MSVEFGGRTSGRGLVGITRPTTSKVKHERNPAVSQFDFLRSLSSH